jgi:hypothetical protein
MDIKDNKRFHDYRRVEKALTILEVLIAILLGCLVGMVLYRMFYVQDRTYTIQSEVSEIQQNLRVAIEKISRDLTMAGFAQPPWTSINGENGADFSAIKVTGSSILDIVGSFDGPQALLRLSAPSGSTEIELSTGGGSHFNNSNKSDISIGGMENAKVTAKSGNTLTIDTDPYTPGIQGLKLDYADGTEVYLVKWKTYWVDTTDPKQPVLRVNEHLGAGGQPLALFVAAMEIAVSGRMVEVTIKGRSRNPDRTTGLYIEGHMNNKIVLRNLP